MPFIGDYGWFYLSARDLILTKNIPLVGITSSHVWLHQGPLWTYILAILLKLSSFNPLSGGYFIAIIGSITIYFIYKLGFLLFSERVGLISAFLYATSPLVIIHSRIPYHTSLIPFFTILLICTTYKWILGNSQYFPLIFLFLAILYNFELATVVLFFIFIGIFLYGFFYKKEYVLKVKNKRTLLLSFLLFVIPMIPIFLYDINHGFPQTIKFAGWTVYKLGRFHGNSFFVFYAFLHEFGKQLIFISSVQIAVSILLISLLFLLYKKKLYLSLFLFGPLLGLFASGTPSEAYLPMLFPQIIICVALFFDFIARKTGNVQTAAILIIIAMLNTSVVIQNNYLMDTSPGYGASFSKRLDISKQITTFTKGKQYNLLGRGDGDKFESYVMGYEYLTLWLGNGPSKSKTDLQIIILDPDRNPRIKIVSSKKP